MKKLAKLKLHNSLEILNDSEMKTIRGGLVPYEEYTYVSPETGTCGASNGVCSGKCVPVEIYDGIGTRFIERTCLTGHFASNGYALNCLCAHVSSPFDPQH